MALEKNVIEWIHDKSQHDYLRRALKNKLDFKAQDQNGNTYWHAAFMPDSRSGSFKPYLQALDGLSIIEVSLLPQDISSKYRAINQEGYSPADILLLRSKFFQNPTLDQIISFSQKIFFLGYQKPFYFTKKALRELIAMVQDHPDKDQSKKDQCWKIILVAMAVRLRSLKGVESASEFHEEIGFYCDQVTASGLGFIQVSSGATLGLVDFIAQIEDPAIVRIYGAMGISPQNIQPLVSQVSVPMSEVFELGTKAVVSEAQMVLGGTQPIEKEISVPLISSEPFCLRAKNESPTAVQSTSFSLIIQVRPALYYFVALGLVGYLEPFIASLSSDDRGSLARVALEKRHVACFRSLVEAHTFSPQIESQFLDLALQSSSYELVQAVFNRTRIQQATLAPFACGNTLREFLGAEGAKPVVEMINLFFSTVPPAQVAAQFSEEHCQHFMSVLMTVDVSDEFNKALKHILRRSAVWTKIWADNTGADKAKFLALIKGFLDVKQEDSERNLFLCQMLQDISVEQLAWLLAGEGYLDLILSLKRKDDLTMPAFFLLEQPEKFAKLWGVDDKRRFLRQGVNEAVLELNETKVSVLAFIVQRSCRGGDPSIQMLRKDATNKDAANFNSLMTWEQNSNLFSLAVAEGNAEAVVWLIELFSAEIKENDSCRQSLQENLAIIHALVARGEVDTFDYLNTHFKSIVDEALTALEPADKPLLPWQWAMIFGRKELFDRLRPTVVSDIQPAVFFEFLKQYQGDIVWEGWLLVRELIDAGIVDMRPEANYTELAKAVEEMSTTLTSRAMKALKAPGFESLQLTMSPLLTAYNQSLIEMMGKHLRPTVAGVKRVIDEADKFGLVEQRLDHVLGTEGLPWLWALELRPAAASVASSVQSVEGGSSGSTASTLAKKGKEEDKANGKATNVKVDPYAEIVQAAEQNNFPQFADLLKPILANKEALYILAQNSRLSGKFKACVCVAFLKVARAGFLSVWNEVTLEGEGSPNKNSPKSYNLVDAYIEQHIKQSSFSCLAVIARHVIPEVEKNKFPQLRDGFFKTLHDHQFTLQKMDQVFQKYLMCPPDNLKDIFEAVAISYEEEVLIVVNKDWKRLSVAALWERQLSVDQDTAVDFFVGLASGLEKSSNRSSTNGVIAQNQTMQAESLRKALSSHEQLTPVEQQGFEWLKKQVMLRIVAESSPSPKSGFWGGLLGKSREQKKTAGSNQKNEF